PVPLRGGSGCPGTPRIAGASEASSAAGQGRVAAALRGYSRIRASPRAQRHAYPEIVFARVEGGAAFPISRAHRGAGKALEILDGRRGRAQALGQVYGCL